MALPQESELYYPVLKSLQDLGGSGTIDQLEEKICFELSISEEDRNLVRRGNQTELGYLLAWIRTRLKLLGFVQNPNLGEWSITSQGIDKLIEYEQGTDRSFSYRGAQAMPNDLESDGDGQVEEEDDSTTESIDNPFDPTSVDVQSKGLNLDLLYKRMRRDAIDLSPSFQRKGNLWDTIKQSRLIESILIRLPLPAFFFDGSNEERWLVVDGLQRLSALKNFVVDKTLKLTGLEFLSNRYEGFGYDQLPPELQRRLEESEVSTYIIRPGTPASVKFIIFKRINTGGLVLEPQEIRHAMNQGIPADFVKELSEMRSFKEATDWSISPDRMQDRDFVTRFVTFSQFRPEAYRPDLDTFMNIGMASLKEKDSDLETLKRNFDRAMKTSRSIFGNRAFRKQHYGSQRRGPINKALFETWSVTFGKFSDEQCELLINRKNEVQLGFLELMTDIEFQKSITQSTGDKKHVVLRFQKVEALVKSILDL